MDNIIALIIGAALGYLVGFLYMRSQMYKDRKSHDMILEDGRRQVEKLKAEALSEVDEVLAEKKEKIESEMEERKKDLDEHIDSFYGKQKEIDAKWELVESKRHEIDEKVVELSSREEEIKAQEIDLQGKIHREEKRLEALAGMDAEEAKVRFLENIEQGLASQEKELVRKSRSRVQEAVEIEAREQIFEIMQRFASECAESRTTSTIYLPSDEIKGRIIGRDGRNIRTIETLTGANILIDDTPETVVVSCFEPHRREVAKRTLERLIEDGRIHPNRIHDVVERVREDIDREMFEAAQGVVEELNVPGLSGNLVRQMGKLQFRYNSAHNILQNSKEVAAFMGLMAAEFNLNVMLAKKIGILHAIGKSFDEHTDDDYVKTGLRFLRKEGVGEDICEAIQLVKQVSVSGNPYAQMLKTAVNLSNNRPGARDENMEFYIRRLHQMEHISRGFSEVTDCMVMQAGREIIVHVNPSQADDKRARALALEIGHKLEEEMSFPGPVHVVVLRESRVEEMIGS
jgi:ribonuclease Y